MKDENDSIDNDKEFEIPTEFRSIEDYSLLELATLLVKKCAETENQLKNFTLKGKQE